MRAPLTVLACMVALTGCGDGEDVVATGSPTPSGAAAPSATATSTPVAGGSRDERAVRRTLVAFYRAQLERDGDATCVLMTRRAQRFYAEGFGGDGVTCERLFGPRGAELFSVGARFSVGAAAAARVVVRGDVATTRVLDETQVLRRAGDRWRIDEPIGG